MGEKDTQKIFSNNLNYYLKLNNKSQLDLAKAIGVSNTTINNYVKGYNAPRMDKLDKICSFFGIKRSDLLEEKSNSIEEKQDIDLQTLIDNVMSGLDNNSALMYKGEPVDDLTRELVRGSVEQAAKIALSRYKDKHNEGNL